MHQFKDDQAIAITQPDDEDDRAWRAQILLEHQQRRKLYTIVIIVTMCVGLAAILCLFFIGAELNNRGKIEQEWAFCCLLPLLLPFVLIGSFVWRCPACGGFLGRYDPQFCPHCGVQLQFLDE